jgi:sugar lactone lactonase YvrE
MTMSPPPVRYALARSRQSWPEVVLAGLEPDPGGDLRLLRLPGVSPPSIAAPADLGASGLALDCECGLYVADTTGDRILRIGLDCGTELALTGVETPRGLCVGRNGWLYAACGDGRIRIFTTPALSLRGELSGFQQPIALACHGGDLVVVDTGPRRVLRVSGDGAPDIAFDSAVTSPADPRTVAVGRDGTIYVGGAGGGGVERIDCAGRTGARRRLRAACARAARRRAVRGRRALGARPRLFASGRDPARRRRRIRGPGDGARGGRRVTVR